MGFSKARPHPQRETRDENCCWERMRVARKGFLQPKRVEREREREIPSQGRLQASPTCLRSWKKLLPLVCATRAGNTEGGGRGVRG